MKNNLFLICFLSAFTTGSVYAQIPQQIYFNRNDVPVTDGTKQLPNAWCGGMNNPQFSLADLNNDGKRDLVIYEQEIGVKTFISTGVNGNPKYVYDSRYEPAFPGDMHSFVILADYNKDNIADLFHGGGDGFEVHIGYYSDNKLSFKYYKGLRYQYGSGTVNPSPGGNDIPGIIDIDGDGDLDFFAYTSLGGDRVGFYKNCTTEDGLPKDSIKICVADACWGKYRASNIRTVDLQWDCSADGGTTCKGCGTGSGNKTTHVGNTFCILDYDGDKDFDLLLGHNGFPDLNLLTNGKNNVPIPASQVDSFISQDTIWSSNGKTYSTEIFPAAFHIDINQDGAQDLLISPHEMQTENYNTAWYYKNTAISGGKPNFVFQSDTYLTDEMIDVGSYSHPAFFDYNRDGKPDLFVGTKGYYQPGGSFKTMIAYYENTSTPGNPSLKLITKDFNSLGNKNLKGTAITFGDVNNDGKDDMVIGQTDGTIMYFLNTAADNSVQPVFPATGAYINKTTGAIKIKVNEKAAPALYDINKDGKKDLVVGDSYGFLHYFENKSDTNNVAFLEKNIDQLGGIKIKQPFIFDAHPTPYIGPIDNTGKEYLLIGSYYGNLYLYDGFESGNPNATYNLITDEYQYIHPGQRSVPACADIDGDGKFEMVVGNELGGLMLYRQMFELSVVDRAFDKSMVKVYPNPARNTVKLEWSQGFADSEVDISIINATGQKVLVSKAAPGATSIILDLSALPAGVYYSVTSSAKNRSINPLTIIK